MRVTNVAVVLLAAVLGVVTLWATQRRLIYFPFGDVPSPSDAGLPRAEAVAFPTVDGLTLRGWFVAASAPTRATAIVFNGNGGNRAVRAPLAARLAEQGIASLLFDYRGYGGNPGSPSEEGLAADARAARRYVASRGDVDEQRIVYIGESLGAAVAIGLAVEQPPSVLILRSPFTSLIDVGRHLYPFLPVSLLLRDRFPSLERVGRITCPMLVIAAGEDRIVPRSQSERMYEAAPVSKRLVILPNVDHNDYEILAGSRVIAAIVEFLDGVYAMSSSASSEK